MVASKHYVKAFQTSKSDRYHWVCSPTDHFLIDGPDLQLIERPETALMQHLRVEVGPGNANDVEGWWASHEMPPLAERYPNVKQLLLLVDKPLINWITMLIMWSNPSDVYVIQVHSGEYLHLANCTDYYDWYCTQNGLEQQRASVQFHGPDGDVERYTSDVCPAEQLDGWEFPPEPSLNWGEYECASEEEEEEEDSGSEGGDSETEGEDSE